MKTKDRITREEYIFDLEEAALLVAEQNRGKVDILKTLDPMSTELTKEDAIILVDEYVGNNKKEELEYYIKNNSKLFDLLQQNLFDYLHYEKEDKMNLDLLNDLDNKFKAYFSSLKHQTLLQVVVDRQKIDNFFSNREELLVAMLQNTICIYLLFVDSNIQFKNMTNNENININNKNYNVEVFKSLKEEQQQKLKEIFISNYELNSVKEIKSRTDITDEVKNRSIDLEIVEAIRARRNTNDRIAKMVLDKGLTTSKENLLNIVNNLSDNYIKYLVNMYEISRSTKENINLLNNATYSALEDEIFVFNLLGGEELLSNFNNKMRKVA